MAYQGRYRSEIRPGFQGAIEKSAKKPTIRNPLWERNNPLRFRDCRYEALFMPSSKSVRSNRYRRKCQLLFKTVPYYATFPRVMWKSLHSPQQF